MAARRPDAVELEDARACRCQILPEHVGAVVACSIRLSGLQVEERSSQRCGYHVSHRTSI
jgi:hypothetical protein